LAVKARTNAVPINPETPLIKTLDGVFMIRKQPFSPGSARLLLQANDICTTNKAAEPHRIHVNASHPMGGNTA
jgi:hypothetical protein